MKLDIKITISEIAKIYTLVIPAEDAFWVRIAHN